MKIKTTFKILALSLFMGLVSCGSDDDGGGTDTPPAPEFEIIQHDEAHTVMADGDVFTATSTGESFGFDVKNLTDTVSYFRIECTDLVNADGSMFIFCWDVCLAEIQEGATYPQESGVISVNPGEVQESRGDKFQNLNAGDGSSTMEFKFRFIQTTAAGVEIAGAQDLNFTYKYVPTPM